MKAKKVLKILASSKHFRQDFCCKKNVLIHFFCFLLFFDLSNGVSLQYLHSLQGVTLHPFLKANTQHWNCQLQLRSWSSGLAMQSGP